MSVAVRVPVATAPGLVDADDDVDVAPEVWTVTLAPIATEELQAEVWS